MFRAHVFSLCMIATAIALPSLQPPCDAQDAANTSAQIRPYLEPTTAIVAHVNLQQTELALQWITKQLTTLPPALAPVTSVINKQQLEALAQSGVKELTITMALQDVVQGDIVAFVPTDNVEATKALLDELVQSLAPDKFQIVAKTNLVIVASKKCQIRQIESTPRTNDKLPASLQACFDSVSAQPIAIGVTVAKALRTEVSNIWPDQLPVPLPIAISPKQIMFDSQHLVASFGVSPTPKLTVELRSDTSVPASADRNSKLLQSVATLVEPLVGKLEIVRADSALQLVANQAALELALKPLVGSAVRQASAASTSNQLKQLMLALHNHDSAFKYLPPRETRDANNKPLLSWRVHILPFVAQQELYSKFHLDEPWDSPHNIKLVAQMPEVYRVAGDGVADGKTRFVLPMLEGSAWFGDGPPLKFNDITDGTSVTIAIYLAQPQHAVTWSKPEEPTLTSDKLVEQLFGGSDALFIARFDGSVERLSKTIDPKNLKALITHRGGEVVD